MKIPNGFSSRKAMLMTLTEEITLLQPSYAKLTDGRQQKLDDSPSPALAELSSVRQSEYYAAKKAGVQLSALFTLWACDYGGQTELLHNGIRYSVERASKKSDGTVELNCCEK